MPVEAIWFLGFVVAVFGVFGLALAYANIVASDKAITPENAAAARKGSV